ncbi:hypothetical protein J4210_00120 [Candidatus Woesearchaeota archaeon]|nr:hypothetical protein [Candidatus Woesearchaeota archaeon]
MIIGEAVYRCSTSGTETYILRLRQAHQQQFEGATMAALALLIAEHEKESGLISIETEGSYVQTIQGVQRSLLGYECDLLEAHVQAQREGREFYRH